MHNVVIIVSVLQWWQFVNLCESLFVWFNTQYRWGRCKLGPLAQVLIILVINLVSWLKSHSFSLSLSLSPSLSGGADR